MTRRASLPCSAVAVPVLGGPATAQNDGALVGLGEAGERDALAVKVSVPAGCSAAGAVVAALRDAARP